MVERSPVERRVTGSIPVHGARSRPLTGRPSPTRRGLVVRRLIWDQVSEGSIPSVSTVTVAQQVERLNVAQVVAGSIPVGHPNFIHAPVAQQVDARDLGSRSYGSCRFESDRGYYARLGQLAESTASNTVKCRFESDDEHASPGSSADRALDYGSRCRRFDSFSGRAR